MPAVSSTSSKTASSASKPRCMRLRVALSYKAHECLEQLVLDKETMFEKQKLSMVLREPRL